MATEQPIQSGESLDVTFGRRVHLRMWDQRMTQVEFGRKVGMDQSSLAKRLRGDRGWSLDQAAAVAAALGTTIDALCTPWDLNPEPTDTGFAELIRIEDYVPRSWALQA